MRPRADDLPLHDIGVGAVVGGLILVRVRPRRPGVLLTAGLLFACGPVLALAAGAPTAVVVAFALLEGAGSIGFGSCGLAPVGLVIGGLLVEPLGATSTLFAAGIVLAALPAVLWSIPGVRRLRAGV
jgi:hypothetical protein